MDSCLDTLGDFVAWIFISWPEVAELLVCVELLHDSVGIGDDDWLLFSDRKELDFLILDVFSFLTAPFSVTISCAKFLIARDSGFGFSIEVPVNVGCCWVTTDPEDISNGGNEDIIEEVLWPSSAVSGPSSGIVGWLKIYQIKLL